MAVERRLTEIVGAVGGKLHTARSRNDQVATDMAMFTRAHALRAIEALQDLQTVVVRVAEAHLDWAMPGYTHLQRAQPVYLSHHLLAYFWMFRRDARRFEAVLGSTTELPLGAGALAGVNFADRPAPGGLASSGSRAWSPNSIDAVSNRDFVLDFLAAAATCATHLSRLGAEIVLWSSEEFGFCEVSRRLGVALLDHAAEEEPGRGRAAAREGAAGRRAPGRAARRDARPPADLQQGHAGGQGAPLRRRRHAGAVPGGGARDARRDRRSSASGWPAAATDEMLAAVDVADMLVKRGVPFRQSHGIVAGLVRTAVESGRTLSQLTPRGARRALRRARRRVLRGAIPGVVAGVQGERGRDGAGPRARAARPRAGGAGRRRPRARSRFYDRPVLEVAPDLLGCVVVHGDCAGRDRRDRGLPLLRAGVPRATSGVTPRTAVLHGRAGHGLRLPLLRHPRAAERGLRARGRRRGGADPRAGAARGLERDALRRGGAASSATARASSPRRSASG